MFRRHSGSRGRRVSWLVAALVLCGAVGGCAGVADPAEGFEPAAGPVLRALRASDPDVFEDVVRAVARTGNVADDTLRLQMELRRRIVPAFVSRASDDAIRDYVRIIISELKELRDASYFRCYAHLHGDPQDDALRMRLEATLSPATRASGLAAMARLVDSAKDFFRPLDETEAWRVLDNSVAPALPDWLGERKMVLRDPASRDTDHVASCEVSLAVYDAAVDLPAPDGPLVLRFMLSRAAALP